LDFDRFFFLCFSFAPPKVINLEKCTTVDEEKNQGKYHCFQLKMEDEESSVFCHAESVDGLEFWLAAFKLALQLVGDQAIEQPCRLISYCLLFSIL